MNKFQCHFNFSLLVPIVLTSQWGLLMAEDQHLEPWPRVLQVPQQPQKGLSLVVIRGQPWPHYSDSKPTPRARALLSQEHLITWPVTSGAAVSQVVPVGVSVLDHEARVRVPPVPPTDLWQVGSLLGREWPFGALWSLKAHSDVDETRCSMRGSDSHPNLPGQVARWPGGQVSSRPWATLFLPPQRGTPLPWHWAPCLTEAIKAVMPKATEHTSGRGVKTHHAGSFSSRSLARAASSPCADPGHLLSPEHLLDTLPPEAFLAGQPWRTATRPAPALLPLGEAAAGRAEPLLGSVVRPLRGAVLERAWRSGLCGQGLSVGWSHSEEDRAGKKDAGCAGAALGLHQFLHLSSGRNVPCRGRPRAPCLGLQCPLAARLPQRGERVVSLGAFRLVWCPKPLSVPLPEGRSCLQCVFPTPTRSEEAWGPRFGILRKNVHTRVCACVCVYNHTCM